MLENVPSADIDRNIIDSLIWISSWVYRVTCKRPDLQQWRGSHPEEPHHAGNAAPPWASGPSSGRSFHHTASAHGSPPAAVASHRPAPECGWRLSVFVFSQFAELAACRASSGSCWPPAGGSRRPFQSASWSLPPPRHPGRSEWARQGSWVGSECDASSCRQRSGDWVGHGPATLVRCGRAPSQRNPPGSCWRERWPWWSQRAGGSGRTPPALRGSGSQTHLGHNKEDQHWLSRSNLEF